MKPWMVGEEAAAALLAADAAGAAKAAGREGAVRDAEV